MICGNKIINPLIVIFITLFSITTESREFHLDRMGNSFSSTKEKTEESVGRKGNPQGITRECKTAKVQFLCFRQFRKKNFFIQMGTVHFVKDNSKLMLPKVVEII